MNQIELSARTCAATDSAETVRIAAFGTFSVTPRPVPQHRNPRTEKNLAIEASTTPSFKAEQIHRDAVN